MEDLPWGKGGILPDPVGYKKKIRYTKFKTRLLQ